MYYLFNYYLKTYFGIAYLREFFPDNNCSRPNKLISNSISGHFYMYTFCSIATIFLLVKGKRKEENGFIFLLKVIVGIIDLLLSSLVMATTYLGGFHTLRQVF